LFIIIPVSFQFSSKLFLEGKTANEEPIIGKKGLIAFSNLFLSSLLPNKSNQLSSISKKINC
jgi:hypothetical protein